MSDRSPVAAADAPLLPEDDITRDPHLFHVVPPRVYITIFLALLVLTATTIQAAYFDLGAFNTPVAIGIASLKALLVVLYFMHVRYSFRLIWVVIGGGLAWLVVFIGLTLSDYLTRGWLPFPGK